MNETMADINRYEFIVLIVVLVIATALTWRYALTHNAAGLSFYHDPFGVIMASPLYAGVMTFVAAIIVRAMVMEVRR